MVQQVLSTLVTGLPATRPDVEHPWEEPEGDGTMLMQLDPRFRKAASQQLEQFAEVLRAESKLQHLKARYLLLYMEGRYRGVVPWDFWGEEIQQLYACLVGQVDDHEALWPATMTSKCRSS